MKFKIADSLVLLALAISLTGLARAQPATATDEIVPIMSLDGASLRNAITALGKQARLDVQFDPALLNQVDPTVTAKWKNVTARQALLAVLDNYGWQMTESPGSSARISAMDPNAVRTQRTIVNLRANPQTNGASVDQAVTAINFDKVALPDGINALALQANLNIQYDPNLLHTIGPDGHSIPITQPIVSMKWTDITARQAVQALLDNYGWQVTQIPGNPIYRIAAGDPATVRSQWTKFDLLEKAPANGAAGFEVAPEIAFDGAPLTTAIWALANQAKLNIQFDPALVNQKSAGGALIWSATITEKWKNMTARQALKRLLDRHGLQVTQTPGAPILRIAAKNP